MRDIVEAAWDNRELLDNAKTQETIRNVISLLDKGELRVAEKINNQWKVNDWVKKLLFFSFQFLKWKVLRLALLNFMTKFL